MFVHDPSDIPGWGGFKYGIVYAPVPFANGPAGETNYVDDTWSWGINNAGSGNRVDTSKPAVYVQMESKYYLGAFASEYHVQFISADGTSTPRLISGFMPHSGTTGGHLSFAADQLFLLAWDGSTVVAQVTGPSGTFDFNTIGLRRTVNNVAFLSQMNAAQSSYVELLRLDQGDTARISAPLYVVGPRAGSAATFPGSFATLQPTSANNNDVILNLVTPTVTGASIPIYSSGSASGGLRSFFFNSNNASGSAHAYVEYVVAGASAGDAYAHFGVNAVSDWAVGLDNSDGDKFKISAAATVGTNDRVTIDSNVVAFGLPPKLPSFTVAGAPSASTAGAGAMLYVSDESGGGVPAFSDGTNWRRVTDRAIIS